MTITDPTVRVASMDDSALVALHKRLDLGDPSNAASVEAHHIVAIEMLKRGMDHGHEEDLWAETVVVTDQAVVESPDEVEAPEGMEKAFEEALVDGGTVSVLLTVDGYVLKADPGMGEVHVDAIMGSKRPKAQIVQGAVRDWKVEDFVTWGSSGGDARGRVERIVTEGTLNVPDSTFTLNASEDDPAVLIRVYRLTSDGFRPTDRLVGHRASALRSIGALAKADGYDVPTEVQDAARKALEWIADGRAGDGFTSVGRNRARQLADGGALGRDTLIKMRAYFARHVVDKNAEGWGDKTDPTPGMVAWYAWGGDAGRAWVNEVLGRVKKDMMLDMMLDMYEEETYEDEEELLSLMDELDLAEFSSIGATILDMEKAGNPEPLRDYWRSGGKGKISWGAGGDFTACVAAVGKYMNSEEAKGYCAIRHREVTGMWPGDKRNRTKKSVEGSWSIVMPDGTTVTYNSDSMLKHMSPGDKGYASAHPQSKGAGEGGSMMSNDVAEKVKTNLSDTQIAEAYGPAYKRGKDARAADRGAASGAARDAIKKRDAESRDLMSESDGQMVTENMSANVVAHQGFIDGAIGRSPQFKRSPGFSSLISRFLGVGMSGAMKSSEPVIKHPGHANQKVHGRRGGEGRPGMGDNVPMSDEDFVELGLGSAGPHITGRDPKTGAPILTPERQALHDKIVLDAVNGVPESDDPTYHMLGGGTASGKTTAIESGLADVPTGRKAVQVNADVIKANIRDTDGISKNDPRWAETTHAESSYVAKRVQAAAFERGQDAVLDGTGDNSVKAVLKKVDAAQEAGYTVKATYVTVPTQMAVDRSNARAAETGRVVPEDVLRETHAGVSRVLPQVATKFDSMTLIDMSETPKVVARATKTGGLKVEDQALWDTFVAKGGE